ncbi:VOC family protein [Sanguibacter sp. 25GB23B1]|uniref:VOC family protein n=1 Tax=unclassified Sanguibacter TaxID=2645534 RepID=UPI0032AFD05D
MSTITPCLWFGTEAEDAATFYVSIFKNSRIGDVSRYGEGGPLPAGTAILVELELDGRPFQALNGGPPSAFTEAVSFAVEVEGQDELDRIWDALLSDGGSPSQCGWLKDRFGVSWQVVPVQLKSLLSDPDPVRSQRVMEAMLPMVKISIPDLQAAYDG